MFANTLVSASWHPESPAFTLNSRRAYTDSAVKKPTEHIGDRIARYRGDESQEALAARAGVRQNQISAWEKKRIAPRQPSLIKLAGAFRMKWHALADGADFTIVKDERSVSDSRTLLPRSGNSTQPYEPKNPSPQQEERARSAHGPEALSTLPTPNQIDIGKLVEGEVDEAKQRDYERLKVQIGRARQVDHAESTRIARIILKTRRRLVEATADLDAVTEALGRQASAARLRGPRLPGLDRGDDRRASGRSSRGGQS